MIDAEEDHSKSCVACAFLETQNCTFFPSFVGTRDTRNHNNGNLPQTGTPGGIVSSSEGPAGVARRVGIGRGTECHDGVQKPVDRVGSRVSEDHCFEGRMC